MRRAQRSAGRAAGAPATTGVVAAAAAALLALGALAGVRPSWAEGTVRSEVDSRRVGVQDAVQLTITVEGPSLPDQVPPPALTNLRVAGGPSVSTEMSFMNGRSSQSRSWTYVLQPLAVGHAEVGAVQVGEASAPPIPIEVVAGSVAPPRPARRAVDPFDMTPFRGLLERERAPEARLMVEAKPSRTSLYVGEPLLVTWWLYTQVSVSGLQFAEVPQFNGFWAEDLTASHPPAGEPATVGGVAYRRFAVFRKLLYPTRSGRLTIAASTLRIGIAPQSLFDGGGVVQRATQPVTVEVKPIPDEPGFSGAVGHFRTEASVDRTRLAFGEAATLRFRVEGSGNLKWVERAPELSVNGAKVYPPQVKSELRTEPGGITGSRTWEFVIVPQTAGSLEIPSLAFSYFDPAARRIVHTATAAVPLRVSGGAPGAVAPPPGAPALAGRDGALRLRTELGRRGPGALPGGAVGAVAVATLMLHGLMWGGGRLARLPRGRGTRRTTPRGAHAALRDLQRVGHEPMSKEAATLLIERSIHAAFGPLDGDDGERARAVRALLDEVHGVRYAPQLGDYSEKLRELAAKTGEVVRRWA